MFAEGGTVDSTAASPTLDFDPDQPRDWHGKWTAGGGVVSPLAAGTLAGTPGAAPTSPQRARSASPASGGLLGLLNALNPIGTAQAEEMDPDEENRRSGEPGEPAPGNALLIQRFAAALQELREVDPDNQNLSRLEPPGYVPTEEATGRIEAATREARNARVDTGPDLPLDRDPTSRPELHLSPDLFQNVLYPEIESGPQGVVITVTGRNAQQRGTSYQDGIVAQLGPKSPDDAWNVARLRPDGIREGQVGEAKYSDGFAGSIYNPDLKLPFSRGEDERVIQQALSYRRFAPDSALTYYTNDIDMAESLVRRFRSVSIGNFRVIIVPATRG